MVKVILQGDENKLSFEGDITVEQALDIMKWTLDNQQKGLGLIPPIEPKAPQRRRGRRKKNENDLV